VKNGRTKCDSSFPAISGESLVGEIRKRRKDDHEYSTTVGRNASAAQQPSSAIINLMDNLFLDYIKARAKAGLAPDRKGLAFCRAIRTARVLGGDYKQIRPYLRNCRDGTRFAHVP
jgi:hypothetical protein